LKNQYFGDINDYRKYGLLRCLQEATGLSLGVCWLLTEDDGRTDGECRRYLEEPARWRHYDPPLYDQLRCLLSAEISRNIAHVRDWRLLGDATDYDRILRDSSSERDAYFRDAWLRLARCPFVFFDPDNGIETDTTPRGRRNSSKYLYWTEVNETYARGHSLIIYQHFPRKSREQYIKERAEEMARRLAASLVDSFQTSHVVFFLAARPEHAVAFESAHELVQSRWAGQIRSVAHVTT
jgi:hypothetical protein